MDGPSLLLGVAVGIMAAAVIWSWASVRFQRAADERVERAGEQLLQQYRDYWEEREREGN